MFILIQNILLEQFRYNLGKRSFDTNFWSLGVKIVQPHGGLGEECGSKKCIPKT